MQNKKIQQSIIKTLAFFDIFNIPLKSEKLFSFLSLSRCQEKDFDKNKIILLNSGKIQEINKYLLPPGSEKNIDIYNKRREISQKRWQKINKIIPWLGWVPFIRLIGVCNSLSFDNSTEESDIDLFIITKKNRLWLTRAITVLFLDLIGQNKNFFVKKNRFCLGFWIDESQMDLSNLLLKPEDIYFCYWLAHFRPVYGWFTYENLINNNLWLSKYLPNWKNTQYQNYIVGENKLLRLKKNFLEFLFSGRIGNWLEKTLAKIQIARVWGDPKNHRLEASVIANQSILKLHPFDKRREYQKKFESTLPSASWRRGRQKIKEY